MRRSEGSVLSENMNVNYLVKDHQNEIKSVITLVNYKISKLLI